MARNSFLLKMSQKGNEFAEFAGIQVIECTEHIEKVDTPIGCLCQRESTGDKVDHTFESQTESRTC